MAAPVDSARQGTNVTAASTTHNVNVGSPVAGTLLIVASRFMAAPGAITFTGYTPLVAGDSSDASDDTTVIWYRWADGTEGATDVCNPTNSVKAAHVSWEVTGAANPSIWAPVVSTVAVGTTAANSANPTAPAAQPSDDYLFIAIMTADGEGNSPTLAPTNYSNLITANSGTTGNTNTNGVVGGASRGLTAVTTDDPGAFTHAAAPTAWTAFTVAIRQPLPAVPTINRVNTRRRAAHRFLTMR